MSLTEEDKQWISEELQKLEDSIRLLLLSPEERGKRIDDILRKNAES
jgi:hypothetical protein